MLTRLLVLGLALCAGILLIVASTRTAARDDVRPASPVVVVAEPDPAE
jgi:hypothetical protein